MEVELDPPKKGEVLVRWVASGLCHSDYHFVTGEGNSGAYPLVMGHEGAGIVVDVGPGVDLFKPGDHFIAAFVASCGRCRWCAGGMHSLCDVTLGSVEGRMLDGTFRFHARGKDFGGMCRLGTFSDYSVVAEYSLIKMDDSIPFEPASLLGCGVPTGWGSAVIAADVEPGDTVVVYGIGGVGMSAVQGARIAGAKNIVVVDPVDFRREKSFEFGATHAAASATEARDIVFRLTDGYWADKAIQTVGRVDEQVVSDAFDIIRKGGTLVLTGMGPWDEKAVHVNSTMLSFWQKRIQGTGGGSVNLQYAVPRLLDLYRAGELKLDEMITKTYKLEEINQGYQDMIDGKNIRGVVVL
jgi:S-(hydroxymethyl)glutathione dehydrogenase/alcohol dehydrogenase